MYMHVHMCILYMTCPQHTPLPARDSMNEFQRPLLTCQFERAQEQSPSNQVVLGAGENKPFIFDVHFLFHVPGGTSNVSCEFRDSLVPFLTP